MKEDKLVNQPSLEESPRKGGRQYCYQAGGERGMQELSEASVKSAVNSYLQFLKNQGKLWYERLNSGSLLTYQGGKIYHVELCEEGTADFIVIYWDYPKGAPNKGETVVWFLEIKGSKGHQSQQQKAFQKIIEAQGCHYLVVQDVGQIMRLGLP